MSYYEPYQDRLKMWRWRLWLDRDIIASSPRCYIDKAECLQAIEIMQSAATSPVRDVQGL